MQVVLVTMNNSYYKKKYFTNAATIKTRQQTNIKTLQNKLDCYSFTVRTSLGFRGYSIYKEDLNAKQIENIKKKLMIKPCNMGGGGGFGGAGEKEYPIYRESNTRLYMPRYYGEEIFGKPKEIKLSGGDKINDDVVFAEKLRPNQIAPVEEYLKRINISAELDDGSGGGGGGLLELPCAYGKTVISLYIISQIRRKTLVIVNKTDLLNQWVTRIQQFLPNARIGRLQGDIIDIHDKDIVIGMLQSISKKDYPMEVFSSFGFSIFDEVHHISSEMFSCALFKIVTKYTLGLSATMDRKDGTTFVFKYFLGDVAFKGENTEQFDVEVRGMIFSVNDAVFNETETNCRGDPQFSRMISKLCDYRLRTEFILNIVKNLVAESPTKQILILAHNRCLIKTLHEKLAECFTEMNTRNNSAYSVGLYIGGMKQAILDENRSKLVLVGSYALASEGLDIKTLSTLVLATPKTDIIQVVGRILRSREHKPLVVDIIDKQDLFQKQWAKRRAYYKKCNYYIKQSADSGETWKNVFVPKTMQKNICHGGVGGGATTTVNEFFGVGGGGGETDDDDADVDASDAVVGKCLIDFGDGGDGDI